MFSQLFNHSQTTRSQTTKKIATTNKPINISKLNNLWPNIEGSSFAGIMEVVELLTQENIKWEDLSDEFKNKILYSIKSVSQSLQPGELLSLNSAFRKINLPFNKFPYEIIRLCVSSYFKKALLFSELCDRFDFYEWLVKLNLTKDDLPHHDMHKMLEKINPKLSVRTDETTLRRAQNILYHFNCFIPNRIHQLFLKHPKTKAHIRIENEANNRVVVNWVRSLHLKCFKEGGLSREVHHLLNRILNKKNELTPRETSSICASLGKINFNWNKHTLYSSSITTLLFEHIPGMNANQLISALKSTPLICFIEDESVQGRRSLLGVIIARFAELAGQMYEGELIECLSVFGAMDKLKLDTYQAEKQNILNVFYVNFISKHKMGFDVYESLLNVICLFSKYGMRENDFVDEFKKYIFDYLNSCANPFQHNKPHQLPQIFLKLEKLNIKVDGFDVAPIMDKAFEDLKSMSISGQVKFIFAMQSLNMQSNPLLKKHIKLSLIRMKDQLLAPPFVLKYMSKINQILLNLNDLAVFEIFQKASVKPKREKKLGLRFFCLPIDVNHESQLVNKYFENLSLDFANDLKSDTSKICRIESRSRFTS